MMSRSPARSCNTCLSLQVESRCSPWAPTAFRPWSLSVPTSPTWSSSTFRCLASTASPLPQVVFATAYDQYAVRAFEVNAVDYLLKPFDRARVLTTLEKARARVPAGLALDPSTADKLDALLKLVAQGAQPLAPGKSASNKVVVRAGGRLLLVDQKDICFASIEEGTISVNTASVAGESNCRTLEELMDQLDPAMFWRAHRSHIVNLQHIREVVPWFKSSYQLRMDDPKKTELPVSRNQTRRLRELFNL
jgi:two-component system response regulator LytT